MIFNFTVANLDICNRWRLTTSRSHICRVQKKARGSERQKAAVDIGFWKLCTAAVHVDTAFIKIIWENQVLKLFLRTLETKKSYLTSTTAMGTQQMSRTQIEQISGQIKSYSVTISIQKSFNQSTQFIKLFLRYTWFYSPLI